MTEVTERSADYRLGFGEALTLVQAGADKLARDENDYGTRLRVQQIVMEITYRMVIGPKVGLRVPRDAGDQPLPTASTFDTVHEQVCADLMQRQALGISRYGQPLQPHNGRRALLDAYQEVLDLAAYLKQHLIEQDAQ